MNVNLYKLDESRLKDNDITSYLESEGYINDLSFTRDVDEKDGIYVEVWIESRERKNTDWQDEIQHLINENKKQNEYEKTFEDLGLLYNVVVVVGYQDELYALPFGHAYNTVARICDREFGMNIASRQIKKGDISSENVNKYFSNVIAQQTYYSQSTEISTDYFESYEGITGDAKDKVFGGKITCSQSVRFNVSKLEDVIVKIIPKIPHILEEEEIFEIPRVNRIPKNDKLSKKLHLHLLDRVAKNKCTIEIPDNFFINNHQYSIYNISQVYVESKKRESLIENDHTSSWKEIVVKLMKEHQVTLDRIKFSYEDNDEVRNKSLVDIARIDLSYQNEQYMLVDGYWCEFNQVYLDHINKEVDRIKFKVNNFLYKKKTKELNVSDLPPKVSYLQTKNVGLEDRIIAYYEENGEYTRLHRKIVKPIDSDGLYGSGGELCDLAFEHNNEKYLVSTKVGFGTDSFLKCIDQSLFSLQILRDPNSFDIRDVEDFLEPDYIAMHIVLKKNQSHSRGHITAVEQNKFKFSQLESDLVKSKLLEWDTKVREFGYKPIIFIDVLDMKN